MSDKKVIELDTYIANKFVKDFSEVMDRAYERQEEMTEFGDFYDSVVGLTEDLMDLLDTFVNQHGQSVN